MTPYRFNDDGVVIITCVGYNEQGELRVKWQYRGGGTLLRNSEVGTTGVRPDLPDGFTLDSRDNVIIAETFYRFAPLIGSQLGEPMDFYRSSYCQPGLGELDGLR